MDKHFIILRKKLSILATIVVFLITLCVGIGFISYQYYRGYTDTSQKTKTYQAEVLKLDLIGKDPEQLKDDPKFSGLFKNFFLLLDTSGSIRYNHSPYPSETEGRELVRTLKEGGTFEDDGYMFARFPLSGKEELVSIVFLPYSEGEYAKDVAEYAGFLVFLSLLIYLILFRLVGHILKPIEENMKTMKYFVKVAGHELKTPLASILSSVQLLSETKVYDEETVHDIENETKKAGELIESLSELSSMSEQTPKEEIYISEILYEVLKYLDSQIKKKRLEVKMELIEDITVCANRYYVFILISNLLSNAVKYNNIGGKICIDIVNGKLHIKDTGIGIGKSQLSKIFDAFYRVSSHRERSEGLGLGLALAKKIVVLYGWDIVVVSEEGKGSEFVVKFNS
ncbi:MAG: HAMP domain-containing sensor histidine kinase [Candidatus Gracilibacteria bacterium]|nr:HAMP domain-containing sensor histidine kinase [Candidatus Gracilibacteria bacterium]